MIGRLRGRCLLNVVALVGVVLGAAHGAKAQQPGIPDSTKSLRVYFGTYTGTKSKGIYLSQLDLGSGTLTAPQLVGQVASPSFLAIHPSRRYLYAVNEVADFSGKTSGAVSAFAIDAATGGLTLLNQQPSVGAGPCYLTVDQTGKNVLVANYGGGSVAVLPIEGDGRLKPAATFIQHTGSSVNPARQKEPHAHSINLDKANRFACAADLGLDKILIYRFDADSGKLTPNDPAFTSVPPGSGPRHFAFHPGGRFAYANDEIASAVTAFKYDADRGVLTVLQTFSTLPQGADGAGNSTAETQVHPSGKFVYVSNRGHNSIAIFSVNLSDGELTPIGHQSTLGKIPRNFGIDPTGRYLLAANQDSDTVVVFAIDPTTGHLTPTGATAELPSPVCVKFTIAPQ